MNAIRQVVRRASSFHIQHDWRTLKRKRDRSFDELKTRIIKTLNDDFKAEGSGFYINPVATRVVHTNLFVCIRQHKNPLRVLPQSILDIMRRHGLGDRYHTQFGEANFLFVIRNIAKARQDMAQSHGILKEWAELALLALVETEELKEKFWDAVDHAARIARVSVDTKVLNTDSRGHFDPHSEIYLWFVVTHRGNPEGIPVFEDLLMESTGLDISGSSPWAKSDPDKGEYTYEWVLS